MIHSLYLLSSDENKFYVGVSGNPRHRITTHLSGNGSRLVSEALLRGIKFSSEILLSGSIDEIYRAEPLCISKYNCLSPYGYNLDKGGNPGGISDRKGSKNTQAILNEDIVLNIREEYALGGITQERLASIYEVNRETISALVRGKSWKEVGGPITSKTNDSRKLDDYSIELIRFLRYEDGLTYDQISSELNIPRGTVAKYGSTKA